MGLVLGLVAWTLSSCQDWLTIYPQDKIVEENYWEDKNDLEGVRYAAYKQMCSCVSSMALWGDLRSDSYTQYSGDQATAIVSLYREIREASIERDSANTYFDWEGFYKTINYCNKVLQHGAEVLERDKQFTNAEWTQMKAEITGLRALNYFYLIRAFKDVPYTTKVINNDSEVVRFGATNQLVVLDSLIIDVEEVAGQARNRFSQKKDTKGLITNPALYAMLSDMYLWRASLRHGRYNNLDQEDTVYITNKPKKGTGYVAHTIRGDYQKAIDYADLALSTLAIQNDRKNASYGESLSETLNYGLDNVTLYKNRFENFSSGNPPSLVAFREIYGGNSEESIFELQFSQSEGRTHGLNGSSGGNGGIWGFATRTHLAISDGTLARIYSGNSSSRPRDLCRCQRTICATTSRLLPTMHRTIATGLSIALVMSCCRKPKPWQFSDKVPKPCVMSTPSIADGSATMTETTVHSLWKPLPTTVARSSSIHPPLPHWVMPSTLVSQTRFATMR